MAYKPKPREEIGRNMSAIHSSENKTESALRKALHAVGLRYRKYCNDLPGRPDIVFGRARVAVFVDGDFWHGRLLVEEGLAALKRRLRTPTRAYWITKFQRRVDRDVEVTRLLRSEGWLVLRFWESDIKGDVGRACQEIAAAVRRRHRASA
jgi:DNA mismatch endonuclease (patch repair protein)